MKKLSSLLIGAAFCLSVFFPIYTQQVFAENVNSIGIATYMPVTGKVEDGDIISSTAKGYLLSKVPYDSQIVGIVSVKPAIALKVDTQEEGVPVVNVGTVAVKVSGANGNIKKGDYITTSTTPGVGMKATKSGYIVGQALEDATFTTSEKVKLITLNLNFHFLQIGSASSASLMELFSISQLAAIQEPLNAFKYVISGIVLIASFGFGFLIFSRAINTGIEALGRNPLAGRMIQLSILFNVVLVIIIIMSGFGIVWLFMRL